MSIFFNDMDLGGLTCFQWIAPYPGVQEDRTNWVQWCKQKKERKGEGRKGERKEERNEEERKKTEESWEGRRQEWVWEELKGWGKLW